MTPEQRAKLEAAATQTYCRSCRDLAIWFLGREDNGPENRDYPNWTPPHLPFDDEVIEKVIRSNFDECPRRPREITLGGGGFVGALPPVTIKLDQIDDMRNRKEGGR